MKEGFKIYGKASNKFYQKMPGPATLVVTSLLTRYAPYRESRGNGWFWIAHCSCLSPLVQVKDGKGKPDLFISKSHLGGDHFQVGDNVTFIIVVGNDSRARSTTSTITVLDHIPVGMHNLRASGHDWDITISHTKSPTRITAKYRGNGSVDGGEILPAIKISGKLTEDSIPHLTNTATVHTKCDCDLSNNKATDTIFIEQARHGQKSNACDNEKRCQGEECKDKSKNSVQGEKFQFKY